MPRNTACLTRGRRELETMAEIRRHFRPPSSAKVNSSSSADSSLRKNKLTVDKLNDLAQDPQRIPAFASLKIRSKSAKCFKEESLDIKKESKKQAWAPKSKQNLASSSSKLQRYGRVDTVTPYQFGTSGKKTSQSGQVKDFGRVCMIAYGYWCPCLKLSEWLDWGMGGFGGAGRGP